MVIFVSIFMLRSKRDPTCDCSVKKTIRKPPSPYFVPTKDLPTPYQLLPRWEMIGLS